MALVGNGTATNILTPQLRCQRYWVSEYSPDCDKKLGEGGKLVNGSWVCGDCYPAAVAEAIMCPGATRLPF